MRDGGGRTLGGVNDKARLRPSGQDITCGKIPDDASSRHSLRRRLSRAAHLASAPPRTCPPRDLRLMSKLFDKVKGATGSESEKAVIEATLHTAREPPPEKYVRRTSPSHRTDGCSAARPRSHLNSFSCAPPLLTPQASCWAAPTVRILSSPLRSRSASMSSTGRCHSRVLPSDALIRSQIVLKALIVTHVLTREGDLQFTAEMLVYADKFRCACRPSITSAIFSYPTRSGYPIRHRVHAVTVLLCSLLALRSTRGRRGARCTFARCNLT